jgi:hypothetical protein
LSERISKKFFAAWEFIPYIAGSPHQWREQGFTALSGFFVAAILPPFAAARFCQERNANH